MARRKRSYSAKSNKGKMGEVFVNNLLASAAKKRKSSKKENARRSNETARFLKQMTSARERDRKKAERESKQRQKDQERHAKYLFRAKLVCEKTGIDEICVPDIVNEAYKAGANVSQISTLIVKGREAYWHEKAKKCHEDIYQRLVLEHLNKLISDDDLLLSYLEDCYEEVLAKRPPSDKLEHHEIINKYIDKTRNKYDGLKKRLDSHLNKAIL